ncbi:WD40 repeat domain-containing protein [Streptomyces sp. NPDC018029]|uniref:WD40 repeat domain-containing protein n=1 Tax=Streptomyces sp. NPDC018029 TaxID=3365032 RepID=UPI0037AC9368
MQDVDDTRPGTGRPVLTPDGRELLSLDSWMTDVWAGRSRPVLRGENSLVSGTFSSDGRFLAVADENGRLTLWDGRARRALAVLAEDGPRGGEPQRVVAFSADGRYVAASAAEGSVQV